MSVLEELLKKTDSAVILGHVRPDGDCVGSTLGLYNYILENYPQVRSAVYLEKPAAKFSFLKGFNDIRSEVDEEVYSLCICLDCADMKRLGGFVCYLEKAPYSICIDHHATNVGFCRENHITPDSSSASEEVYKQLAPEKISRTVAECLYTGIIHDTGVFKYSCTSAVTMEIAGSLMKKGIDFGAIIDDTFYRKTYIQNQILGRALLESMTLFDGKCIVSALRKKELDFYGVTGKDLDGIIDQLRLTQGIEVAIFLYELEFREFKVSLRAQYQVDVSRIAAYFGGGGHVKAAGCTISGNVHDVINNLAGQLALQLGTGLSCQENEAGEEAKEEPGCTTG